MDAFSNPSLQTQNLYFDLKQWGIEVGGLRGHAAAMGERTARSQAGARHVDTDQIRTSPAFHPPLQSVDHRR